MGFRVDGEATTFTTSVKEIYKKDKVEIPDGYRFVKFGIVEDGEEFLDMHCVLWVEATDEDGELVFETDGQPQVRMADCMEGGNLPFTPVIIVEKIT